MFAWKAGVPCLVIFCGPEATIIWMSGSCSALWRVSLKCSRGSGLDLVMRHAATNASKSSRPDLPKSR